MKQLTESLKAILVRELTSLRMEIEAYPTDADLWRLVPGISNSGGTLALHLSGNLQHFVGAILGKSGYLRNRDTEFAARELPRSEVLQRIEETLASVQRTFDQLDAAALDQRYPEPVAKVQLQTGDFLVHLASHLSYHLGQIDYHRRMVSGGAALSGTVSPTRLWSAIPAESA